MISSFQSFPIKILYIFLISPINDCIYCPSHPPWFNYLHNIWWRKEMMKSFFYASSSIPLFLHLSWLQIIPSVLCSQTFSICAFPLEYKTTLCAHKRGKIIIYSPNIIYQWSIYIEIIRCFKKDKFDVFMIIFKDIWYMIRDLMDMRCCSWYQVFLKSTALLKWSWREATVISHWFRSNLNTTKTRHHTTNQAQQEYSTMPFCLC